MNKYLAQLIPIVDAIAETFGENCEVVLHDTSNPAKSIVKIANGHITGREVGGPLTDLGLHLLEKAKRHKINDLLIGYETKNKEGAVLKSTTVFIRDNKDKILGSLCINIDISIYLAIQSVFEKMTQIIPYQEAYEEGEDKSSEKFAADLDTLINILMEDALKKIGKPLPYMQKEDKLQVIRDLKEKGLFLIKGSVKRVSKELNVSVPTIYKYLEQI